MTVVAKPRHKFPSEIRVAGALLSVEEHRKILEMKPREIEKRYGVGDGNQFKARVRSVIDWWESYYEGENQRKDDDFRRSEFDALSFW